jgi:Ca-activated chloride channel family protein
MHVELLVEVADQGATVYVVARLEAQVAAAAERNPVNLALLIDRSSSMRGPRIAQAKRAALELIERLDERDRLTVIGFDGAARALFGPAPVSATARQELAAAVEQLETGVGTNLGAALKKGAEAVSAGFVRNAIARVILLTDGQPSVGILQREQLAALVEAQVASGVTTTTMGIGEGFDDELLAELARRGHGGFYYLATPADIPAAFGRELEGVFAIAARDTEVKLVPTDEIGSVELLHRMRTRPAEDGLVVEVGQVAALAPRQLLFRLGRAPGARSRNCGTMRVTYRRPDGRTGDGHIAGIELPETPLTEQARVVALERLRLEAAVAVDTAWARRAAGDNLLALEAMRRVKERITAARDQSCADPVALETLLRDIAEAEEAVTKSAAERERIRRGQRERSQVTLLGNSTAARLPPPDRD